MIGRVHAGEDSVSFYDVITTGQARTERLPIVHHGVAGRFAIRKGNWKLVMESKKKDESRELYDLKVDPEEQNQLLNPGGKADFSELEDSLVKELSAIIKSGRTTPGKAAGNDTGWWDNLVWMEKW